MRASASALVRESRNRSIGVVLVADLTAPEARRNAQEICKGLAATDVEQIVLIQVQRTDYASAPVVLPTRIERRQHEYSGPLRRSVHINEVIAEMDVDRVWIHDSSLWLPFTEVVAQIRACARAALKPFAWFVKLPGNASERLLEVGRLQPSLVQGRTRIGQAIGKSSFVVDRDLLRAAGGLSEAFRGAGDEGFELMRRLRVHLNDLPAFDAVGAQLFCPAEPEAQTCKQANKLLQDRLSLRIEQDPETYLRQRLQTSLRPDPARLRHLAALDTRQRALSPSAPCPAPVRAKKLPGTLWALTCYFNPMGYRSKRANFEAFRAGLAHNGVSLLVVELAFGGQPFELGPEHGERLLQLRSNDEGLLWQKERLLNLGLEALPAECDKVAWLDADILFSREDWAEATARALQQYVAVQCFTVSVRLRPGETQVDLRELPLGAGEHEVLHSMAYGHAQHGPACLDRYLRHGHSGYAWAARRALLTQHGLYDRNILGNADLNIAHALLGGGEAIRAERLSSAALADVRRWADGVFAQVGGSVGYVEGAVRHLWHGSKSDRRYHERLKVLIDADFDPARDLKLDPLGLYRWATDKPALHAWCKTYFRDRNEDGQ